MGNIYDSTIATFKNLFSTSKKADIAIVGLDAAGKTAILYTVHSQEEVNTIPTIGFNVEEVRVNNVVITCWDMGGQSNIRELWGPYVKKAQGIVFVADVQDGERFENVKETLKQTANECSDNSPPFLILANKMDRPDEPEFKEMLSNFIESLELENGLGNNSKFKIFSTSTVRDPIHNENPYNSIVTAFSWLINEVNK